MYTGAQMCVDVLCTVCVDVLCMNTDMRWSLCVLMFCAGAQLCSGHCVCCCFVQEHSCVVVTVLLFCAGTQMCSGHCVCWCFVQEHRCVVVTVCVNVLCTVCVNVLCRNTDVWWSLCVLMFCAQCVLMFCAGAQLCGGHRGWLGVGTQSALNCHQLPRLQHSASRSQGQSSQRL